MTGAPWDWDAADRSWFEQVATPAEGTDDGIVRARIDDGEPRFAHTYDDPGAPVAEVLAEYNYFRALMLGALTWDWLLRLDAPCEALASRDPGRVA